LGVSVFTFLAFFALLFGFGIMIMKCIKKIKVSQKSNSEGVKNIQMGSEIPSTNKKLKIDIASKANWDYDV
jgi:hypothetical protein